MGWLNGWASLKRMLIISNIISWVKKNPAIKATWFAGIVSLFALILNTYVLYQNSQTLSLSRQALLQTMQPSVDLQFAGQTAYLTNTSTQALKNICLYPIIYRFDKEYHVIDRNQPRGNLQLTDMLLPGQRIKVPDLMLLPLSEVPQYNSQTDDPSIFRVAVITYQRSTDLRRFASLEIYHTFSNKGSVSFGGIFAEQKYGGWSGPPERFLKIIDIIESTEKAFFKVKSFE